MKSQSTELQFTYRHGEMERLTPALRQVHTQEEVPKEMKRIEKLAKPSQERSVGAFHVSALKLFAVEIQALEKVPGDNEASLQLGEPLHQDLT
ncbi:hypothetical protein SRHO_G00051220 [Serrasalmus rhombeus]